MGEVFVLAVGRTRWGEVFVLAVGRTRWGRFMSWLWVGLTNMVRSFSAAEVKY